MQGQGTDRAKGDAAVTVEEFNTKLESFRSGLVETLYNQFNTLNQAGKAGRVMGKAGLDVRATVISRVMYTGQSADGGMFSPYSTKPFWVTKDSFKVASTAAWSRAVSQYGNKKKKRGEIRSVTIPGGYAEIRRLQGLQARYKDFWVRGGAVSMWSNFGVTGARKTNTGFIITLGGMNRISEGKTTYQDLIDYHSEREGQSIIALSTKEAEDLVDTVGKIVDNELQRAGI